jgi:hypothetical protein
VVTVTVSPAANGWLGMKLPPCPSESAWIVPLCDPLVEPTTWTDPIWPAGMPRKVIWVCGSALDVFGKGYTLTAGGWASAVDAAISNTNAATEVAAIALLVVAFSCLSTSCNL